MNFSGNVWFINFNGIGNGIIIAPILACFEKSFPSTKYFHTENEVLSDIWFTSRAGLKNIIGFTPIIWRRFNEDSRGSIKEFILKNNIDHIINLRNEGPENDTGYYMFKDHAARMPVTFIDLDFNKITLRKKQENLTGDIILLLQSIDVDMSSYNSKWLVGEACQSDEIGFGMAGSHKNKRWSPVKWIDLAKKFVSEGKKLILFPGKSKEETVAALRIKEIIGQKCEVFEGKNLHEIVEKIRNLRFFITNDTGLLHIAAAANVYTIGLYTCTDPNIWAPLNQDKFSSLKNDNFIYCPSPKIYCGNCLHYYDDCPAIIKHEDTIDPTTISSLVMNNKHK